MASTEPRRQSAENTNRQDDATTLESDPPALMVDERGMICDCNRAIESLFGYRRSEVVWRHLSMLLPQMQGTELMLRGHVNPKLQFLSRIGKPFAALDRSGELFPSNLFFNELGNSGSPRLRVIVRAAD